MKNKNSLAALLIAMIVIMSCRFSPPDARDVEATPSPNAGGEEATEVPAAESTVPASEPQIQSLQFTAGHNDYVIEVDNTPRQFVVFVPSGYDPNSPTPVVFMIHGSNQSGELMYKSTDWADEAEQENFIVVYPTSWHYMLTTSGRVEDKWNVHNLHTFAESGAELKDDVKFIRAIVELLKITFNVDAARIYASGFSNGGAFVNSRLIPEMNDVFAAYSTAGAAIFGPAAPASPEGDFSQLTWDSFPASLYTIVGSNDEKVAGILGVSLPFPVRAEEMTQHPSLSDIFTRTPQLLSLSPTYEVEYEQPGYATMTFKDSPTNAGNQFVFRMVNNMGHIYPSIGNNRYSLNAAALFWDFFSQYHK